MRMALTEIEKLKSYDKNPRVISEEAIQAVANSIREFGFNQPILCDENYRICAGHTRFLAAKKLELKKIPVIKKKMSKEEFSAYNLADNKTGEFSQWEKGLLGEVWEELDDFPELKAATALEDWEVDGNTAKNEEEYDEMMDEVNEKEIGLSTLKLSYSLEEISEIKQKCSTLNPNGSMEEIILGLVRDA